jgi:crossover junction endodeoxyribonuclease RuvC
LNTKVIGIDQSLVCSGICITDGTNHEFHRIETKKDGTDAMTNFKRVRVIADTILDLCKQHDISVIAIEGLAMGNIAGNSNRDLAGLQYIIIDTLIANGLTDITIIPPTVVKKFASGKGNCKKPIMFEFLPESVQEELLNYPKTRGRFDIMDAYFIATYRKKGLTG